MNAIRHGFDAAGHRVIGIMEIHVVPPDQNKASLAEGKGSV
jgi:hypothetical protein